MSRVARRQERSTAVAVGTLYVVATLAGVAAAIVAAIGGAPTAIDEMAGSRASVLATAGSLAVMAVAVTGVGVMLYPVLAADATTTLRRGLAAWYAASRVIEGALFMVAVATLLAMLAAAESPARGGDPTTGVALRALFDYSFVAGQTVFSFGALFVYWLLLVSGRVPRWLAVWGLVAAPMMLVGGLLLPVTGDPNSAISSALYAPLALQEMVLAVWLIGWGFRPARPPGPVNSTVAPPQLIRRTRPTK